MISQSSRDKIVRPIFIISTPRSGSTLLFETMLEQTIHLPIAALYDPARSPLAILERLTGRTLVPIDRKSVV